MPITIFCFKGIDAMYSQYFERASNYSRLLRLITLIRIRWFAIICQTMSVLFVAFYLGFPLPLREAMITIAFSALVNIFLNFYFLPNHRISSIGTTLILGLDIALLSLLLYFTGGLQNPFSVLLIAPAALAATSLEVRYIVLLNLFVIGCATLLSLLYLPLPWYQGQFIQLPQLLIVGTWAAIISSLIFTTFYSFRVAEEARKLADALTDTELILMQEKHLSALDGLAAAAAHELGTPLATIQLVAKELSIHLKNDPSVQEDVALLISQGQRCREILQRLTSLSTETPDHFTILKLTSAIEEAVAPLRDFDVDIIVTDIGSTDKEPELTRNPGILYGLGNLIENAVDFARSKVMIEYKWTNKDVEITITDDGMGFPPNIIDRIGEPYTTSRESDSHGGGLGLGLFIAKTLLERSGAHLHFSNNLKPELGAEIKITWPRSALK